MPRRAGPRRCPTGSARISACSLFFRAAPARAARQFEGGHPQAVVLDPEVNRSYDRIAAHYEVGILPARPRKPRDTAKVEAGARFAQSYILGRLRHLTFFSLAECKAAIREALNRTNERPMRRLGISRRQLFEAIEQPVLGQLPAGEYISADWTPERFQRWGRSVGTNIEGLILALLANRLHPEQGFRTCVGVMRLLRGIDPKRAEQVAGRAIKIGALNYKSIASILAHNLDRRPSAPAGRDTVIVHANIRGPRYFH